MTALPSRAAAHARLAGAALLALASAAAAFDDLSFGAGLLVSEPGYTLPGGAMPGGATGDAHLIRVDAGSREGRLVAVYTDANGDVPVWSPRLGTHLPRDVFVRVSDDEGASWSDPVNLSGTTGAWSTLVDGDGDGAPEEAWGDSTDATLVGDGDVLVVTWLDTYCPQQAWTWGDSGTSAVQGSAVYADAAAPAGARTSAFRGVQVAVSTDGGDTWTHGGPNAPLAVTYGRRDADIACAEGASGRWIMVWQEDPAGLQLSDADGPGTSGSGAVVSVGTDVWYSWASDLGVGGTELSDNRTPLTNHATYDVTSDDGFPAVAGGAVEARGASRCSLRIVQQEDDTTLALAAYEETREAPLAGKEVRYHAFDFSQPVANGPDTVRFGARGVRLSEHDVNARDAHLEAQAANGSWPAVVAVWREGLPANGEPGDVMLKATPSLDLQAIVDTTTLNVSTNTPVATLGDMLLDSAANPGEDAHEPVVHLCGDVLVVGYAYTGDHALAHGSTADHYGFWIRRSIDGAVTWASPQDVSALPDTSTSVRSPTIAASPFVGGHFQSLGFAWATETNVDETQADPVALDVHASRTLDSGLTIEAPVALAATPAAESAPSITVPPGVGKVFALSLRDDGPTTSADFAISSPWQDLGDALGGVFGEPELRGIGPMTPGSVNVVDLRLGAPASPAAVLVSASASPTPFKGGTLVPVPALLVVPVVTEVDGSLALELAWPAGTPAETNVVLQIAIADAAAPAGVALSNGLRATSR